MSNAFPWYVIHKDSKFVIAGFIDHADAETFVKAFTHGMYVIRDRSTVESLHRA
jgi:hypothetical protein